ncbi:MAG TPA: right-handed parallel beta-helix repeat-containing protein, partial [Candidatus Ozemobacteraceae bacterium]|nr:right-handed parallel beta-helix repeat-containing protein [Candidatus Ozemobacteraceae bacterium]
THAVVSWKTTEFTNGVIEYGDTETFGATVRETTGQYATLHSLTIPNLKPEKRYYFKIVAARQNRTSETSEVGQFTTISALEDATPPSAPRGIDIALTETPNQVTVFWVPNTESDLKGYKIYRSELPTTGFTALEAFLAKGNERFTDVGVVTGKKYYYRVTATDQGGNESSASEIVSMVIPGDLTAQVLWTRANSPYILYGDLTVAAFGKLTIDSGVVVKAGDYDALKRGDPTKIDLRIEGGLVANASGSEAIVFSSVKPTPRAGDWAGIVIAPNDQEQPLQLVNVEIAYADRALAINSHEGTMIGVNIHDCGMGVQASAVADLALDQFAIKHCTDGLVLTDNMALKVTNSTVFHCRRGLSSSNNASVEYLQNNFLEYVDFGLKLDEQAGTLRVHNNLFVSGTGVALQIVDQVVQVTNNTIDSPTGLRIDKGTPIIEKNFIFSTRSVSGEGLKGIEHLAGDSPLPVFGPNDVYGFPQDKDYVGCASSAGSLASEPYFMKDFGGGSYDYRLRFPFPDNTDLWGILRDQEPTGI